MPLTIAYIAGEDEPKKPKQRKLSDKEEYHRMAVAGMAAQTIKDRAAAKRMFRKEREELEALIKDRDELAAYYDAM